MRSLVSAAVAWVTATVLVGAGAVVQDSPRDTTPGSDKAGQALTEKLCSECHDAGTFLDRHRTPGEWRAVIDEMSTLGAVLTEDEVEGVIGYLGVQYGKVNVNTAGAVTLAMVLELTDEQAAQVVEVRDSGPRFTSLVDLAGRSGLAGAIVETRKARIVFSDEKP